MLLLKGLSDVSGLKITVTFLEVYSLKDKCVLYWCFVLFFSGLKPSFFGVIKTLTFHFVTSRHFVLLFNVSCMCFALLSACALIRFCWLPVRGWFPSPKLFVRCLRDFIKTGCYHTFLNISCNQHFNIIKKMLLGNLVFWFRSFKGKNRWVKQNFTDQNLC